MNTKNTFYIGPKKGDDVRFKYVERCHIRKMTDKGVPRRNRIREKALLVSICSTKNTMDGIWNNISSNVMSVVDWKFIF